MERAIGKFAEGAFKNVDGFYEDLLHRRELDRELTAEEKNELESRRERPE
mgnify:FL=1